MNPHENPDMPPPHDLPHFHLVMAEDNDADVELFRVAMKKANMNVSFTALPDGEELMRYLKKEDPYQQATTPDLILLDINMPRMNGFEVLKAVKNDEHLKTIPILMLTSSNREEDVETCYKEHANSYIVKPLQIKDFICMVASINQYWTVTARTLHKDGGE